MASVENIKDWLDRAAKNGMEREDAVFLMVEVRHLIEGKHDIANYRTTELYCDWTVHPNLYTSYGGYIIIRELTKILAKNWSKSDEDMVREISNVLGLSSLRTELIKLFEMHSIPTTIFSEYENWKNVVGFLTFYLRGKPINFPSKEKIEKIEKKHLTDLIQEIESIKKPADFYIKKVSIVGDKAPFWCIELGGEKNTTKIMGELVIERDK